jgi:hypothetical protein
MAVAMEITVVLDVAPYSLVDTRNHYFHRPDVPLKLCYIRVFTKIYDIIRFLHCFHFIFAVLF